MGSGHSRGWQPGNEKRRADWELWAFIPHCEYWKAVALSLDLEPPVDASAVKGWPSEYERRRKITMAHIESKNLKRSRADNGYFSVDLPVFSAWAHSLGWSLPDKFPRAVVSQSSAPASEDSSAGVGAKADDWRKDARQIADECFALDTENKCRDSLAGYSRRVMDEMQARNIHGPRGLIDNSNTIQRDALQGSKWWQEKKK